MYTTKSFLGNENDDFSLNSEFAFEWNRKLDTDFLEDNNPQDFILDLRELYLTWYIPVGEIKIGKQIHIGAIVFCNTLIFISEKKCLLIPDSSIIPFSDPSEAL